jgi:hypothetical protein
VERYGAVFEVEDSGIQCLRFNPNSQTLTTVELDSDTCRRLV